MTHYIAKAFHIKDKVFLFAFLLSFYFSLLCAQSSHTLTDVLTLTLLNNSELNAFNYDLRAGDAKILQASFRPNPTFSIETENLGAPIFGQTTFLLGQTFEIGGKRNARMRYAQTEKDRIALDYEVKKRQLFVETTLLFIDVLINQKKIIFLEDNLKILQAYSTVVEQRAKAGKASVIEESNFTILLTSAAIELNNAQNELRNAKIKLSAQWNDTNENSYIAIGDLDGLLEVTSLEKMGEWIQEHPEIVRSYFEDNLRTARIGLEKSKGYPDVSVVGGPRYLKEAYKWVWVVGASAPIPIDHNQGGIWESYESWEKLEKERATLWTKLLTELNTTYANSQTILSELELLKRTALPAAQKAYDFSYKGYELARYNYLEMLETERAYRTTQLRYLQALGDYHKSLAVLQGLVGSKAILKLCE